MGGATQSEIRLEIDRVTTDGLMALVGADTTHPMQAGAVLFLGAADDFDLTSVVETFGARVAQVPRLHQLRVDLPLGCGRPIWVEDADFGLGDQMATIVCPTPANDEAVLAIPSRAALFLDTWREQIASIRRIRGAIRKSLNDVVISVLFLTRRATVGSELGNHRGVTPLVIPTGGDRTDRPGRKMCPPRGLDRASRSAISRFGPSRRLSLVRRPSTDDQHRVSSVPGPEEAISMLGCTVTRIVPLAYPPAISP